MTDPRESPAPARAPTLAEQIGACADFDVGDGPEPDDAAYHRRMVAALTPATESVTPDAWLIEEKRGDHGWFPVDVRLNPPDGSLHYLYRAIPLLRTPTPANGRAEALEAEIDYLDNIARRLNGQDQADLFGSIDRLRTLLHPNPEKEG